MPIDSPQDNSCRALLSAGNLSMHGLIGYVIEHLRAGHWYPRVHMTAEQTAVTCKLGCHNGLCYMCVNVCLMCVPACINVRATLTRLMLQVQPLLRHQAESAGLRYDKPGSGALGKNPV